MQENVEQVKEKLRKERGDLPTRFLMGTIAYMLPNKNKNPGNDEEEENMKNGEARGRKRKEPSQKDNEAAEKPELKKTKK